LARRAATRRRAAAALTRSACRWVLGSRPRPGRSNSSQPSIPPSFLAGRRRFIPSS
jgi:hypothetical protein